MGGGKARVVRGIAMEGEALQESHGAQLYLLSSSGMGSGGEMILFRAWHTPISSPDNEEVNALGKVVLSAS